MTFLIDSLTLSSVLDAGPTDSWSGATESVNSNVLIQFLGSHDLIFVVLGVSLVIWFILIGYLVKLERKLTRLEKEIRQ